MVSLIEALQIIDLLSDSCIQRIAELLPFAAKSGYLHPDDFNAYVAAKDRINLRISISKDSLKEAE